MTQPRLQRISLIILLVGVYFLFGCINPPENFRLSGISKPNIKLSESRLSLNCKLYNPNNKKIVIKKMNIDIMVEGFKVANITNPKKISLSRMRDTDFEAIIALKNLEILKAVPVVALKLTINIRIEGEYKAGLWFYSKNVSRTENYTMNPQSELYKTIMQILSSVIK